MTRKFEDEEGLNAREKLLAYFTASALGGLCKSKDLEEGKGEEIVNKALSIGELCYDAWSREMETNFDKLVGSVKELIVRLEQLENRGPIEEELLDGLDGAINDYERAKRQSSR